MLSSGRGRVKIKGVFIVSIIEKEANQHPSPQEPPKFLDKLFKLKQHNTTVRTELLAGLTSFLAMSYIIFVNPQILADAGIPHEAALAATIYISALVTLLIAFWANYPIGIAPGMGLNAFFAYTVVIGHGLSWQTALGAVFISGVLFFVLTVTKIRQLIIDHVPDVLKTAIVVGIGLFISFIGFTNAELVVADESTYVALGDVTAPGTLLALVGLVIAGVLMAKGVKGALLIAILATTAISMIFGYTAYPTSVSDVVSFSLPSLSETFLQMDIMGALGYGILSIIFTFTIVEMFDNMGTFIGLTKKAGLVDKDGKIMNIDRALQADAIGTMTSATFGSTALNAYVENATGISEGGRTGLTAVTIGVLFLASLIFAPLVGMVPTAATAPILILVGAFMLTEIKHLTFDDYTDVIPAFLTIVLMPLTYSIAEGLAFGFISYTLLKLLTGRHKELHWIMYVVTIAFVINFVIG